MKTVKLLTTLKAFLFVFILIAFTQCKNETGNFKLYEKELHMIDSVRKAYNLSPGDSSITDFFMKEVRYKNFGVSIYRLEDSKNRHFLFSVLKNDYNLRVFPLIDNRLLEENKMSLSDTNQLDLFLKETLKLNGENTLNWFDQHQFLSEKILLPILDLHEIHANVAEKTLLKLNSDTTKILYLGRDCRPEYIKTYQYIIEQQKSNAPKFFYKHPRYDEGLIYELDFANPNGEFKVKYLN